MASNSFKTKLQTLTGATAAEITAVAVILGALIAGMLIRATNANEYLADEHKAKSDLIFRALDSLAEAEKTTFVGTDIDNSPDHELAIADTVIEKEVFLGSQLPSKKDDFQGIVNLNTASKVQLMKVPGIGEKTAMLIIEYRQTSKFHSIEDIMNIKGIGIKKFEKMKNNISVD